MIRCSVLNQQKIKVCTKSEFSLINKQIENLRGNFSNKRKNT